MKEIRIEGLTTEQVDMLDTMWQLESSEEFDEWIETLSPHELRMALILKELILAHCIDEVNNVDIAKDYLQKFRL